MMWQDALTFATVMLGTLITAFFVATLILMGVEYWRSLPKKDL